MVVAEYRLRGFEMWKISNFIKERIDEWISLSLGLPSHETNQRLDENPENIKYNLFEWLIKFFFFSFCLSIQWKEDKILFQSLVSLSSLFPLQFSLGPVQSNEYLDWPWCLEVSDALDCLVLRGLLRLLLLFLLSYHSISFYEKSYYSRWAY